MYIYIYIYIYIWRRLINPITLARHHGILAKPTQMWTRASCGTGESCLGATHQFPRRFFQVRSFFRHWACADVHS